MMHISNFCLCMQFLGWMHRKLMQNSTEPMKNSKTGAHSACLSVQTLFDDQNYHVEPTSNLPHSNINSPKSSHRFKANMVEVLFQEESFEPFDFLAIGTFGRELLNTDPPTPTLPMPNEALTDQQEITEYDLQLINYELEKFLEAEEKEIANDISGRDSEASIITLSSKPIMGAHPEGHMYMAACPLQNYLFATCIELAETNKEVKKEKTSLEELFKRNNIVHDDPIGKCEGAEQPRKRNAARFLKKVLKKFHSSSSSSTVSFKNDAAVSISIKKKLSKALKMFQKKVHPEEMTEKQIAKLQKGYKKDFSDEDGRQIGHNENKMVHQAASKKSEKNIMKLCSNSTCKDASTTTGGHWIKTDSDYLVLELQG
ncbi:protein LAZY 1-like isoform X1 [Sesamum indicum]|uniref:Protein LAZY 1-like isoform X1 n=1 Tax=Sesamum indicum TaxID=4182 RepID=A0A8M8V804_SESIN|nr:protein LAZY 1-like isoform X1 [Sesamum indicum]